MDFTVPKILYTIIEGLLYVRVRIQVEAIAALQWVFYQRAQFFLASLGFAFLLIGWFFRLQFGARAFFQHLIARFGVSAPIRRQS